MPAQVLISYATTDEVSQLQDLNMSQLVKCRLHGCVANESHDARDCWQSNKVDDAPQCSDNVDAGDGADDDATKIDDDWIDNKVNGGNNDNVKNNFDDGDVDGVDVDVDDSKNQWQQEVEFDLERNLIFEELFWNWNLLSFIGWSIWDWNEPSFEGENKKWK